MEKRIDKYLVATGLKFPSTEDELKVFERSYELYSYELSETDIDPHALLSRLKSVPSSAKIIRIKSADSKLSKSQNFFRRVVLAAKIADECYQENTFGSVKFQKLIYLCEQASCMNFNTKYTKQAAGPMDSKFLYSVRREFEKQKWFHTKKIQEGNYQKVKFFPSDNVEAYKSYYTNYYSEVNTEIQHLIDLFRKSKTDDVELIATIYSCWGEIKNETVDFSTTEIVRRVYAWHEAKKKFSEKQITDAVGWMNEQGIYPL